MRLLRAEQAELSAPSIDHIYKGQTSPANRAEQAPPKYTNSYTSNESSNTDQQPTYSDLSLSEYETGFEPDDNLPGFAGVGVNYNQGTNESVGITAESNSTVEFWSEHDMHSANDGVN